MDNRLQSATKGDKSILHPIVRVEIAALNGPEPERFKAELWATWLVIALAITFATTLGTWWAAVMAVFVIGTRQNVLGLLVHEQAHMLGLRGRFGDMFVNLFAGYPLLILTVEGYAQVHLAHHRNYFKPNDPDFARKSGEQWAFPKSRFEMARIFLTDLTGLNLIALVKGKKPSKDAAVFVRRHPTPAGVRPLFFILVMAALALTGTWMYFLLFWVVPLLTVTQVLVRWGAICEHEYNRPEASVAESTPLIVLSWWEKLLIPNLNFSLHTYHHFFPGIAFSNLPKVHAIYEREGLLEEANIFHGNWAYFKFLTK